uniref:Deoxyuridine 5'-triphosphate nucleotidohydrolase n=1 Tax=Albugo laibachii Nc14 TaxID=890382 RepID=F0WX88_9STRA|nr:deoxyuridine 5'triphosphate nucleotidohydrolase put [Albugo laibachii Nc14]|eukprot:CCA26080.1 deoxyuridine 5'triphosphate nucleotidohydrolase put [Albugo laibachii Nc14]
MDIDSLCVLRLSDNATLPSKGSQLAAGFDLSSAYDMVISARGTGLVKTDIAIMIPQGCYARVAPRSGLALHHAIDVGGGVIDADYRGNVGVILFNHSSKDFSIKRGDRIAQLVLEQVVTAKIVEVTEIDQTDRGSRGFGSTGVSNVTACESNTTVRAVIPRVDANFWNQLDRILEKSGHDHAYCLNVRKKVLKSSAHELAVLSSLFRSFTMDSNDDITKIRDWLDTFITKDEIDIK